MRYQFYREHKYVSSALNDVERLIAKTDFEKEDEVKKVESAFSGLKEMLTWHAYYENDKLHSLLKAKNSCVFEELEKDHENQDVQLEQIEKEIQAISSAKEKVSAGYQLYLNYRKFVSENLHHLNEEESLILPELQRLYGDTELKQVEAETYKIMTSEQLIDMMQVLFPHMNKSDKNAFLSDIKEAAPEKYNDALKGVQNVL